MLIMSGLFLILSAPLFLGQMRVLRDWPTTEAQVVRSGVVVQPSSKHDQLYAAQLQISYQVNGRTIVADLTSYQSSNYQQTEQRAAEYPVGSRQAIRYDPANPSQARVGAGWNRRFFAVPLITLGIGLAFTVLAAAFFVTARMVGSPVAS